MSLPLSLFGELSSVHIACFGDIILDTYIVGNAHRLSPEAPVAVLHAHQENHQLGGGANVARNLAAMAIGCTMHGFVGDDRHGATIRQLLSNYALCQQKIESIPDWPTTVKTRLMAGSKHLLRVDYELPLSLNDDKILDLLTTSWPLDKGPLGEKNVDGGYDAILLSDYGKGLLSVRVTQHLIQQGKEAGLPVIIDPKGRDYTKYKGATLLTPNAHELAWATQDHPTDTLEDCEKAALMLIRSLNLEGILVTRGADGMAYINQDGLVASMPAEVRSVYDVSGAGDTVVAMMAAGLALGWPIEKSMALATLCAGIVVGKVGTAVVTPQEVREAIQSKETATLNASPAPLATNSVQNPTAYPKKITSLSDACERVHHWQKEGYKVGFTNGCFDLLHAGHLSLLDFAKSSCDRLIVGVNSDVSVKSLKGPDRPLHNQDNRAQLLAALHQVDGIIIFDEATPAALIEALKPDVLIKGADYTVDTVVGAQDVLRRGGQVLLAPLLPGHSTTSTVARLKKP